MAQETRIWSCVVILFAALSAGAFTLQLFIGLPQGYDFLLPRLGGVAFAIWIACLIGSYCRLGRRARWLLLTVPFVLFWPGLALFITAACMAHPSGCP